VSGRDLTRGLGTRLTIISAGRHRPYPGRPRAQAFNGLANSIWAGTKNPAASVKWVEYLASADCQDVVASKAVVFPAIKSSSEKAAAAFEVEANEKVNALFK